MASNFTLKRDERVFVKEQTAWGTIAWADTGSAVKVLTASIQGAEERVSREDLRSTRSVGKTTRGKRSCTWSLTGYILPSGALGFPFNAGVIFKHAFGKEVITGGTDIIYTLLKDIETAFNGLSITRFGNHFVQTAVDAVVQELTIKGVSGELATFEASGDASDEVYGGTSTVGLAASAGSGTVQVAINDGVKYSIGTSIEVNGIGIHKVTAVAGDILSVTPSVTAAQVVAQTVAPSEPTQSTFGDPLHGISGSFLVDGVAIPVISSSVKISNNFEMRNNEYGTTVASGFSGGTREVTFETELHLTPSSFRSFGRSQTLVQSLLNLNIGAVAGSRLSVSMAKTEADIPAIEIPDTGETSITLSGRALPNGLDDEVVATFN